MELVLLIAVLVGTAGFVLWSWTHFWYRRGYNDAIEDYTDARVKRVSKPAQQTDKPWKKWAGG